MANTVYDNFYLSNEIEDQYNSHLDLQNFCTVDNTLTGTPGMLRKIHVYKATDGTEKLSKGEGNTKSISVDYTEKEYRILLAQNRFQYYDEEAMTDPMVVTTGTRHAGIDLFNTANKDIFAEFNKATLTVEATAFDFATLHHLRPILWTTAASVYSAGITRISRTRGRVSQLCLSLSAVRTVTS